MRKKLILTLLTSVSFFITYGQDTIQLRAKTTKFSKVKQHNFIPKGTGIIIRCSSSLNSIEPLVILDGVVINFGGFKNIPLREIESISVLNGSNATALIGERGIQGVIIVTTKTVNLREIIIKDNLNNEPLPGSTVDLITIGEKRDTIRMIADSMGKISTRNIVAGKNHEIRVSSIGYKTKCLIVNSEVVEKQYSLFLERDTVSLTEAVVVAASHHMRCRLSCVCSGITIRRGVILEEQGKQIVDKIFPNPALISQPLTVVFSLSKSDEVILRMVSADGKTIIEKKFSANMPLCSALFQSGKIFSNSFLRCSKIFDGKISLGCRPAILIKVSSTRRFTPPIGA